MSEADRPSCTCLFEYSCLQGKALQDEVYIHYPDGDCEGQAVSSYSPGRVEDAELLTRLIIHPIHYDTQTGIVSPLAFNDATTIDLSVFREKFATDAEIQMAINEVRATGCTRIPPQDRVITLIMQAEASEIRASIFEDDGTRMCRIYDTGEPSKPAHASVFTPTRARKGSSQRSVRRKLLEIFSRMQVLPEKYRALVYEGRLDA